MTDSKRDEYEVVNDAWYDALPAEPPASADVECIEWPGAMTGSGYGSIYVRGRGHVSAHRWVWEIANGPIPDGLFVLHRCDNKRCVNPVHLFVGTHTENVRDMDAKGRRRAVSLAGEARPTAKLTEAAVREMRRRSADGESSRVLAREFGISPGTAQRVIARKDWAHVE